MQMQSVKSSQIAEVGFDEKTGTLAVRFHGGGLYHYAGVGKKDFESLTKAKSIGSHFSSAIKGKFKFTKVPEKKEKK